MAGLCFYTANLPTQKRAWPMLANLCVEARLRELVEQGFEVTVVKDATAGPRHPELGDGYASALVDFGCIASGVLATDEVVKAIG